MKTKQNRQGLILDIITENTVETQEQLIEKLREAGYPVTQATISRDIRELRLTKVACGFGVYKYVVSNQETHSHSAKYLNILKETVTSTDHAGNIVVVKTYAGMAQAVATGIDNIKSNDILGCVAGDDTIFVVVSSNDAAQGISAKVKTMMAN